MNEFNANLKNLYKLASTWVVFIVTTAATYWISLPIETQAHRVAFTTVELGALDLDIAVILGEGDDERAVGPVLGTQPLDRAVVDDLARVDQDDPAFD